MTLTFDARVPSRDFDLRLTIAAGETLAVMGRNGAGKSTLLELLAGLLRADSGSATLDGRTLFGPGDWTPPHRRGVTLLAQEALLFPHLSALDNVAFGPRSTGASRSESRTAARLWLDEVDAATLADARPGTLSGGQAQRVAVARALASQPRLLLLDEPMAALDIAAAPALRRVLRRVLADRTAVVVTHEPLDALLLADRVVVLDGGRIVEQGPTRRVFERPTTEFMAGLAGMNLLRGVSSAAGFVTADGVEVRVGGSGGGVAGLDGVDLGTPVTAVVRPSAVAVSLAEVTADAATNALRETVVDVEPRGDLVRIRGEQLSADLPAARVADLDLAPGDAVRFAFAPSAVTAYASAAT